MSIEPPPEALYPALDTQDGARTQYAALCWRAVRGKTEVLLVTSRDTGRWIIPKGWPITALSPAQTAAREAWEEAGVHGKTDDHCVGVYSYQKVMAAADNVPCIVAVYPIRVKSLEARFPERHERRRKWLTPKKAAQKVDEPELREILANFSPSA